MFQGGKKGTMSTGSRDFDITSIPPSNGIFTQAIGVSTKDLYLNGGLQLQDE